jgi:hypothetical protein
LPEREPLGSSFLLELASFPQDLPPKHNKLIQSVQEQEPYYTPVSLEKLSSNIGLIKTT